MKKFSFWVAKKLHRNQKVLIGLVLFGLIIGVAQNVGVSLLLANIKQVLSQNSKSFLGADLEIRGSAPLTEVQRKKIIEELPQNVEIQTQIDCVSIAITSENSKRSQLVNIQAVSHKFPFYGELKLKRFNHVYDSKKAVEELQKNPEIWVGKTLKTALGLSEGKRLKLGEIIFVVKGFIDEEPGQGLQAMAFGPRVYMGNYYLEKSGLLNEGSRANYSWLVKLPLFARAESEAAALKKVLGIKERDNSWKTPFNQSQGLQVTTHTEKAKQWIRLYSELEKYFKLISIISLTLTSISVGCMFLAMTQRIFPQLGVLYVLGVRPKELKKILALFLGGILILGVGVGAILGVVGVSMLRSYYPLLPKASGWLWTLSPFFTGIIESLCLGSLMGMLPLVISSFRQPLRIIAKKRLQLIQQRRLALLAIGGLLFFLILTFIESGSFQIALFSTIGLICCACLIYLLFYYGVPKLPGLVRHRPFVWQFGVNNIFRYRRFTVLIMTIMSVGVLCLGVVGHYKASYIKELSIDQSQAFPDLFLVGITPSQQGDLQQFFYQWPAKLQLEPLVKGRWLKHNGSFVETMIYKDEAAAQLAIREQNLSYRDQLSFSEDIISGQWMKGWFQNEASIEAWFAKQLNIQLGDTLTLSIQGVEVDVKVTSIRRVRWSTFRPNYFILVSPKVLAEAPKEFLGTISGLNEDSLVRVQSQLLDQFPNITAIPIKVAAQKIRELLKVLFWAVQILTSLAILTGVAAVIAIILLNLNDRLEDIRILKILGFQKHHIFKAIWIEHIVLIGVPILIGVSASSVLSWLLITKWTSIAWVFPYQWVFEMIIFLVVFTTLVAWAITKYLYHKKYMI